MIDKSLMTDANTVLALGPGRAGWYGSACRVAFAYAEAIRAERDGESPVTLDMIKAMPVFKSHCRHGLRIATGEPEEPGPHLCFGGPALVSDPPIRCWIQERQERHKGGATFSDTVNINIPSPATKADLIQLLALLGFKQAFI